MNTLICVECGKMAARNSSNQKYCRGCAAKKRYIQRPSRKKPVASETDVGRSAWDLTGKTLSELALEARAIGMTYGKYISACSTGTITEQLINMGLTPEEAKYKIKMAHDEICYKKKRRK